MKTFVLINHEISIHDFNFVILLTLFIRPFLSLLCTTLPTLGQISSKFILTFTPDLIKSNLFLPSILAKVDIILTLGTYIGLFLFRKAYRCQLWSVHQEFWLNIWKNNGDIAKCISCLFHDWMTLQDYQVDLYLRQHWFDPRLNHSEIKQVGPSKYVRLSSRQRS